MRQGDKNFWYAWCPECRYVFPRMFCGASCPKRCEAWQNRWYMPKGTDKRSAVRSYLTACPDHVADLCDDAINTLERLGQYDRPYEMGPF